MARLILLFLLVTLSALVSSAPQHHYPALLATFDSDSSSSSGSSSSEELHRLARSPHHDGTDHDHDHDHEEKTDQDHEHPVLSSGDAKKASVGVVEEPKYFQLHNNTHVGGLRVQRDTETENNLAPPSHQGRLITQTTHKPRASSVKPVALGTPLVTHTTHRARPISLEPGPSFRGVLPTHKTIGDTSSKPRATRDTAKDSKDKDDHPAATSKDDAEDDKPKHLKINESSTIIGGGRVVRDTQQTEKPVALGANAPGPFLLKGEPIHTHLDATHDSSSSEEKSSEEHKKSKRESPTPPPGYKPKYNGEGDYNPLVQPHLDPTPPPSYKTKRNSPTAPPGFKPEYVEGDYHPLVQPPKPESTNEEHKKTKRESPTPPPGYKPQYVEGDYHPLVQPPKPDSTNEEHKKTKRESPTPPPGYKPQYVEGDYHPLVQPPKPDSTNEEHKKTKRNSPTPPPGYIPKYNGGNNGGYPPNPPTEKYGNPLVQPHLDPTPPPGYKPRYNRDTGDDAAKKSQGDLPLNDPNNPVRASARPVPQNHPDNADRHRREADQQQSPLGAPVNPPPPVHIKTEDGRDASIALPPIPSGPQGPKHKRDTTDPKLGGPLSPPAPIHIKTEDGRDASIALPPVPGPQGPKQHKRETPVTIEPPKFRGTIPPPVAHADAHNEKDEHKQKRDTYSQDHKEESPKLALHEQSQNSQSKLTPPIHESEYDRHARAADKDASKSAETHSAEQSKSAEVHDHSKTKSSEEKKDA